MYSVHTPEEVLERIAYDHLPDISAGSSWREAGLGDSHLKSKVNAGMGARSSD
jgi:hypothetical protein